MLGRSGTAGTATATAAATLQLISTLALVALLASTGCGSSGQSNGGTGGRNGSGGVDASDGSAGSTGSGGAPGADGGGQTCGTCLVHGRWQVDNLSPCFVTVAPAADAGSGSADGGASPGAVAGVVSTQLSGGTASCPTDPTVKPTVPWSTDTLTTDCPGHYRLCVVLKAGNAKAPAAGDCTVVESCADDDYAVANQAQMWAKLPGWMADSGAISCAQKLHDHGGYALLTVSGTATGCGTVQKTLSTITYCPFVCMAMPTSAECGGCMSGGRSDF
ncbi:MAG: hypothetical protein QOI66_5280 [Myxococcales bacterium]|nr:hypothetical protein [Myxococcales bacterium]